jgi:hypothetical protein
MTPSGLPSSFSRKIISQMRKQIHFPVVLAGVKRSQIRASALLALAFCLASLRGLATTVTAPDFDSLVGQADYVVRAVVKSVSSEWRVDGANRSIITNVELTVREVIKGSPPAPLVLQMLGGSIGGTTMVVEGAPTFKVGDDDILFIHGNGQQFSPLVGIMYGRYPISHDSASGQDYVLRSNGSPLYDSKDVTKAMTSAAQSAAHPLTAAEFAGKIRASVSQHLPQPSANAN